MGIKSVLLLGMCGCAGVYGELAATQLSGTVDTGGTAVDVKTTALGLNVGIEFGNTSRRFTAGYAHEEQSYDVGDGSFDGAAFRFDFNVASLSDKMKVRVALGVEAGNAGASDKESVTGLLGGLAGMFVLPWDSYLHVMLGGAYRSGGGDSAKGFTARIAVSHKFGVDHSDREVKKREKAESNDPLLAKLKESKNLPPEEIFSTLQRSCSGGNRWSCLLESINQVQRDGDRATLAKRAKEGYDKADYREDELKQFAYVLEKCAAEDDWPSCQEVKARFVTYYPWANASGTSFAKLFPSATPPDDFPMAALDKVPPGRGWFCFHYSGTVQTIVTSEGPDVNVEAVNLGCQRTVDACTQMLATAQSNTSITTVGNCVAYDGMLWLYDERGHFADEKLCKDQAKLASASTECVPVGDVAGPGL